MTSDGLRISSLVCLLLAPGCSLPRAVTATNDSGIAPIDAFVHGIDVGPPTDSGVDARAASDSGIDAFTPPIDSGMDAYIAPIDAWVAPLPDAWVMPNDAWSAPMPDASTPCDRGYGGAPGYMACPGTTSLSCVFYVDWTGGSSDDCDHVCGGHCVGGIANGSGSCTPSGTPFACNQSFQHAICTCSPP